MSAAVIWSSGQKTRRQSALRHFFSRAPGAMPHFGEFEGELWTKLIWNCALNAVSALAVPSMD